jgi:hypothetical protein
MPLPEMHGRTHIPVGYAAAVQAVTDPTTLLEQGTTDQVPCIVSAPGATSFCVAETSSVSVSGLAFGNWIPDLSTGTTFRTNDAATFPAIYHDTGKTPAYGIQIPANTLVEVTCWLQLVDSLANGPHEVSYIIDGSYSVTAYGPSPSANSTREALAENGLTDDKLAPRALIRRDYLGDTATWVVGPYHLWYNWTNDPQHFKYGIIVTVVGSLPV